jgi:hypothetical protein
MRVLHEAVATMPGRIRQRDGAADMTDQVDDLGPID